MFHIMKWLFIGICAAVLCSCATNHSPQTRIQKNPQLFNELSPKEKALVNRGQIAKGMSTSAVFLSWGNPDKEILGYKNNESFIEWRYTRLRPSYSPSIYGTIGYPYRRRSYRNYVNYGLGIGSGVHYIPEKKAAVWFKHGKVNSWEQYNN